MLISSALSQSFAVFHINCKCNSIMKKNTLLACIVILSLCSYGQSKISFDSLISEIKNNKNFSLETKKTPLVIEEEFFNETITDYDVYRLDENNFRILAQKEEYVVFQFIYRKGRISGIALNLNEEYGYEISNPTANSDVVFSKVDKASLIFTCGMTSNQSHISSIKGARIKDDDATKMGIGNSETTTDPLLLESRPGATHLIYLDYDGESSLPGWENFSYSAVTAVVPDEYKRKIWEAVAEDLLPFDVNVTNNRTLYDDHANQLTKGWVVLANFGIVSWRGIAILESYGSGTPVLVNLPDNYDEDAEYLFRTPSHELGHGYGLNHDGSQSGAYYLGHGEYSPIMGNGPYTVSHWSKGEYAGATNTEDDIAVMNSVMGEFPDDYTSPHTIVINETTVSGDQNFGFIGTHDDTDTFEINLVSEGDIAIAISSPHGARANLDVVATLIDSEGNVIETSSPIGDRNAYIDRTLPMGTYYIIVDGGGELGVNDGFSDYGSLGYYELSGRVGYLAPESSFSFENGICSNDGITFSNQSIGTNVNYEWTFEGANITSSTNASPTVTYPNPGIFNVSLKTINLLGEDIIQRQIHVGANGSKIEFATEKLNPELTGTIVLTDEIISFTYDDLSDLDQNVAFYDLCLLSSCYTLQLNNVYLEDTCGYELWQNSTAYLGGDQVSYLGNIYKAKWWTTDLPTNTATWDFMEACIITDEGNPIRVFNGQDTIVFETNPLEVGHDLYIESQFCGSTLSVSEFVTAEDEELDVYPNPTSGIVNIKGKGIDQIIVYNVMGSRMGIHTVNGNEFKLDTSNYRKGIYFIEISYNDRKVVKKICKE